MQTSGTLLLADKPCSSARVRLPVQDCRRACRLLYSAAVQISGYEQEQHQGRLVSNVGAAGGRRNRTYKARYRAGLPAGKMPDVSVRQEIQRHVATLAILGP